MVPSLLALSLVQKKRVAQSLFTAYCLWKSCQFELWRDLISKLYLLKANDDSHIVMMLRKIMLQLK